MVLKVCCLETFTDASNLLTGLSIIAEMSVVEGASNNTT